MSTTTIIALLLSGFLMVFLEVFIPGGVLGLIGAVMVLIAVVFGFLEDPEFGLILLGGSAFFGLAGFYAWVKWFPRSPFGKRLILQDDAGEWHGFEDGRDELVGKCGVAHTTLRPAGTAIIDGQRVDVVTRGEMVAARAEIRVVKVEGNRVVVTAHTPADDTESSNSISE